MRKEFKKIWNLALPFQDKRDDLGHAEIVTKYSSKLCAVEKANPDIVVPAAILHDIGWSKLSGKERFLIFNSKASKKELLQVRTKHQVESVKLAKNLLIKAKFSPEHSARIIEIISKHDTRKGFLSKEDGIMRDADKLWRYSKTGVEADLRRRNVAFEEYCNMLENKIDKKDFFFSKSAKRIAKKELELRRKEAMLA